MILDILWGAFIYVIVPTALGAAAAFLFWRKRRIIIGNAIGSGVIAVVMILFIIQLFGAATTGSVLSTSPDGIMLPMGGLVALGWLDVLLLFFLSGAVEERVKKRIVNPDDF